MKQYDEKLIMAFLENYRTVDIARASGYSTRTVERLKADPAFQAVLTDRRTAVISAAVEKMRSYLLADVEELQRIITDAGTAPQTKVNAIKVLMDQLRDWSTTSDLARRLQALEGADFTDSDGV